MVSIQAAFAGPREQKAARTMPESFVYLSEIAPDILQEVRYAGSNNFVGAPITGYEKATIVLTRVTALQLAKAQAALQKSSNGQWSLKVYDGYRPQRAVDHFWTWAKDPKDQKKKAEYYPDIADKKQLFAQGYIAQKSGHSRGSTVDLTIVRRTSDGQYEELDMGSPFDFFGTVSHYANDTISEQAQENRKYLRELMEAHGFLPYEEEWWHFTLDNEPYPDTYFDFPIR